ncbi:MAG: hypothetical protein K2X86_14015 [Cytophagaceae bacterium]|nr:hypothetical protein [Cytophagaceae bacterium]
MNRFFLSPLIFLFLFSCGQNKNLVVNKAQSKDYSEINKYKKIRGNWLNFDFDEAKIYLYGPGKVKGLSKHLLLKMEN